MVLFSGLNEHRIHVHAYHGVAHPSGGGANPTGATSAVEHPRTTGKHGVNEAGLTLEICSSSRHVTETLDVPVRMIRVGCDNLLPQGGGVCTHSPIVGRL